MRAPSQVPAIQLNSGTEIPQLGFGVFLIPPEETEAAVRQALEIGYRHIDTAQMYGNERQVGEAVRASGLRRHEVFVTSKLSNRWHATDEAVRAFDRSLEELGLDHVDLFLIHWPLATVRDFMDAWRALERVHREGRARAIGVSNFQPAHLERLLAEGEVAPAVNQIEVHPYLVQDPLRAVGAAHGIVTEAWSPIGRGKVLADPVVTEVAQKVGRTPAQVVLRWHLQRGDVIFPKSSHAERMRENFALFDFELDERDMARLTGLDRGERIGPDPDHFAMVPS